MMIRTTIRTISNSILVLSLTLVCQSAFAQQPAKNDKAAPAKTGTPAAGDKIDVTDLENKYWAAKDTDYNVVQNRLYNKAGRLALSLQYGSYISDPWSEGSTLGVDLGYYFSERYGIELQYSKTDSRDTSSTAFLKSNSGGAPDHGKMKGYDGIAFNWVPIYAKVSVLNSSVVYFDLAITPGIGVMNYEQQKLEGNTSMTTPAFSLAITQQFFLSKHFALRFDYKNYWYSEEVTQYHVPASGTREPTTRMNNTSLLLGGITLYY